MKTMTLALGAAVLMTLALAPSAAEKQHAEKQRAMVVNPAKAEFKEVVPGVSKKLLWGDDTTGPYGAYTKFEPGVKNPLHTHSSELRIVVLKGAYIFTPKGGKAHRVGAGEYVSMPAGMEHESAADPKAGALFYEESPGKFDLNPVK